MQILTAGTLLTVAFLAVAANRFSRMRVPLRDSWSSLDIEMRRRYNLLPHLVATVSAYAEHERGLLDAVTMARARAAANNGDHASQIEDEQRLVSRLREMFAMAQAVPALRADRHFQGLTARLVEADDRLAAARRAHNANVREWNALGEALPWRLARGLAQWSPQPYFSVEDALCIGSAAVEAEASFVSAPAPAMQVA